MTTEATLESIELKKLKPFARNARTTFDQAGLKELAASLKRVGLQQPLLVRPLDTGGVAYEIVAGERRYRAARLAKLKTLDCFVREMDDAEAVEINAIENLDREDLNAIEEARAFANLIEVGGLTQTEAGKRFGLSQPQIANRLRLLELPEEWQQRVISGEISASVARELVPWAGRRDVLEAFREEVESYKWRDDPWRGLTVEQAEDDLLHAVCQCSRPYSAGQLERVETKSGSHPMAFKVTPKRAKELDVVEVGNGYAKQKRCLNVARWDELQEEALARKAANGNGRATKKRTPEEEATLKKQRAELFQRKLYAWKIEQLRERISGYLGQAEANQTENQFRASLELLLWFAVSRQADSGWYFAHHGKQVLLCGLSVPERREELDAVGKGSGFRFKEGHWTNRDGELLGQILDVDDESLDEILIDTMARWVKHLPPAETEQLAEHLGIKIEQGWELTREFLELHSKDQLVGLAKDLKVKLAGGKRSELIDALLEAAPRKVPSEVLKVKRPK